MSTHRYPPTRSGGAVVRRMRDEEVLQLACGEPVMIVTARGLAPLHVERVRFGLAGEAGALVEIPVVEAQGLVFGVPDLYTCAPGEADPQLDHDQEPSLPAAPGKV